MWQKIPSTVALNLEEITKNKIDDWKKIQKNNVTIAVNIFYAKKEKIYPAYFSKHNSNQEREIIF